MADESLANVKQGDQVILIHPYLCYTPDKIERVERTTPTQIVLSGSRRYWKASGERVGYESQATRIEVPTPERLAKVKDAERHKYLVSVLSHTPWQHYSLEKLEEFVKLL